MHSGRSRRRRRSDGSAREPRGARGESTVASRVDGLKVLADALGAAAGDAALLGRQRRRRAQRPGRAGRAHPRRAARSRTSCARRTSSGSVARGCRARSTSTAISSACSACVTRVGGLSLGPLGRAAARCRRAARRRAARAAPAADPGVRGRSRPGGCTRCAATAPSVRHHYDVSNAFYELLLGPSLVYSCAYFASERGLARARAGAQARADLPQAAAAPGERLLDIGCGWGSLVLHAAAHHGVRALGVTLSEPQAELARAAHRGRRASPTASRSACATTASSTSSRSTRSPASACTSTSAARSSTRYVGSVHRLLRPGGLFLNHGITRLHTRAAARPDVHRPLRLPRRRAASGDRHHRRARGRRLRDPRRRVAARALRADAAALAREPRGRRDAALAEIGEERERVWRLYMLGSALGFEGGEIGIYQMLAARSGAAHAVPLDRSDLVL